MSLFIFSILYQKPFHISMEILGQKPRRTKAPKDRSPAILAARTEAPRLKHIYFKFEAHFETGIFIGINML